MMETVVLNTYAFLQVLSIMTCALDDLICVIFALEGGGGEDGGWC